MLTGNWYELSALSPNAFRLLRAGGVLALALAATLLTISCGNSSSGDSSGSSDEVAAAMAMEWVTVGDPGNAADDTGFGAVGEPYRIGKFEVTNNQYTQFLNAVATTDANGLYNPIMASKRGGITRSGSLGNYTYSTIPGREDWPVSIISFWNATRFANWLHNGQPTGAQDNTTTEDGAYTLTVQGIADNSITRNAGATVFIPSEDEWYKAAYYNPGTASYFDYPAGSDAETTCSSVPRANANTANCSFTNASDEPTDVGSFTGSASPYGSFDQGGNLTEWTDHPIVQNLFRFVWGGSYDRGADRFEAPGRSGSAPSDEFFNSGFRVASIPERVP